MAENHKSVAVIGAGPVGLFAALLVAQRGIKVEVFEAEAGINQSPRAVAYFPPVLEEFAKAGIINHVIEIGEKNSDGCDWKAPDGNLLAAINPPPDNPSFAVCLSQPELGAFLLEQLLATKNAHVFFNRRFQRLEQRDGVVTFWTKGPANDEEETEHKSRYLIAADGGRSAVRRSLGIEMEGFTFDSLQFVAVNFRYPLREEFNWKAATFVVDPVDWGIVAKRGQGPNWRFATGVKKQNLEKGNILDQATIELIKQRLVRIIPGDASRIEYEAMAPYTVHQRCASRFQEGNVLLAGDAAHLNNPVGGLGLTTGLLDAAHLGKAIQQVLLEGANANTMTKYAETRRRIFLERTNPASIANLMRLNSQEPAHVAERADAFAKLNSPRDFINATRIGLPDFSLTSTSDRIFDTTGQVTWFISVKKIPEWTQDKFQHEYKTVHANMAREGVKHVPVIRRYVQLENSGKTVPGTDCPPWDYVTCLTWPSLFVVHAGFADPGYRATAGAHIFCRLDQEGCLVSQVAKHSRNAAHALAADERGDEAADPTGTIQALIFHKKADAQDDYPASWFTQRSSKWKDLTASDDRLRSYVLWRDVTPKDVDYFFRDTQFSAGSWHKYKAVETLTFPDQAAADSFFEQHGKDVVGGDPAAAAAAGTETETVIGVPELII